MRHEYVRNPKQVALDHASGYGTRALAGDGAFGAVYTDETTAYKVLRERGSTAYLAYITRVAARNLRSAPRIADIVHYKGAEGFVVVTLEKLLPARTALGYGLRDSFGSACKAVCEALEHGSFAEDYIVQQVQDELGWSRSLSEDVVSTCSVILDAAYATNTDSPLSLLDLRGNNVMRRNTGELVITDPLAF